MAHLLIIELPGGNDTDIVRAAVEQGHQFTFMSSDLALYERQPEVMAWIEQAAHTIEVPGFDYTAAEEAVLALHARQPLQALLCLIDIRLIEAARLAKRLGLRHLNPDSAVLLRDKYHVRCRLAEAGLEQPEFALALDNDSARKAVQAMGLPVLIKPADGYGSQNILTLRSEFDLGPWLNPFDSLLPSRADYGLGVMANDRLLLERYMGGQLVGCDTFTAQGQHQMLGVNEKLMMPPPSFAIRGGCFTPYGPEFEALQHYVFAALDAVGFDHGAAHTEVMMTDRGPRLVEINARIVGAKIPRLVSIALRRDMHADLIDLHLGRLALPLEPAAPPRQVAVTRWLSADAEAWIDRIELPHWRDSGIRCVEMLKHPGDWVRRPFENADRIGYVMASGPSSEIAQALADRFIGDIRLTLKSETGLADPQQEVQTC